MTGRPVDQTHNHFIGNIIAPPNDRLSLSGLQSVSLLGPFPIAHNTPNLVNPDDNGYELPGSDLSDGEVLLSAWVELADDWTGTPPIPMDISIGTSASCTLFMSVLLDEAVGGPYTHSVFQLQGQATHTFAPVLPRRINGSGARIVCAAYTDDSQPSPAGSGNVYALVATPA